MRWKSALPSTLALPALLALSACQDSVGPAQGEVEVAFRTVPTLQGDGPAASATMVGANGTLRLDRMLMVVGEFELEGAADACIEVVEDLNPFDDCESFEVAPFLLDLALDATAVTVVQEGVRAGTYSELEFEVEDISVDDDGDDSVEITLLEGIVRSRVADWPDGASMLVEGVFFPLEGNPRPFRVFIDAEVDIELGFDEPLVVREDGRATITVVLDPSRWFSPSGVVVVDLSLFDFTGDDDELLELEVELEDGFTRVEIETEG